MKQVRPAGGTVPPSAAIPHAEEGGKTIVKVGLTIEVVEVSPSVPSFVLVKRKQDGNPRVSGRKKSKAPLSLRALMQAVGLTLGLSHPSSL